MIDVKQAESDFVEYVKKYDLNDFKIKLKLSHSIRVEQYAKQIAQSIELNDEDVEIATMIGLFHDVGRFEQIKRYNTFIDAESIDHAHLEIEILKETKWIEKYINNSDVITMIYDAIEYHNKLKINDTIQGKTLVFAKIIRDADKIDILELPKFEGEAQIYNLPEIKECKISQEVYNEFFENKLIDGNKLKNGADKLVYSMGYIYDLNYKKSFEILKKNNSIDNLMKMAENSQDEANFEKIKQHIKEFVDNKINI